MPLRRWGMLDDSKRLKVHILGFCVWFSQLGMLTDIRLPPILDYPDLEPNFGSDN